MHLQEISDFKDQNQLPTIAQPLAADTVIELGQELENFKKVDFLTCLHNYDLIFSRYFHQCELNCKVHLFTIYFMCSGISSRFVCSSSFKHFGIIAVIGRIAQEALLHNSVTKNHTNHLLCSISGSMLLP